MAKLKNGVCECKIVEKAIIPGKSIYRYYVGMMDKERLLSEIIPDIKAHLEVERSEKFPMLVYSYYSGRRNSNNPINDIKIDGRGIRFKPKSPVKGTKTYDWLICEDETIIDLRGDDDHQDYYSIEKM